MVICEKLITTPNEKLKKKLCLSWSRVNCIRSEPRARLECTYKPVYYLFFLLFVALMWVTLLFILFNFIFYLWYF